MKTRNTAARMSRNPSLLCRLKNLKAFDDVRFRAGDGVLLMIWVLCGWTLKMRECKNLRNPRVVFYMTE